MDLHLILASQSPRRSMLLEKAGYVFSIRPSNAEELDAEHHDIHRIVIQNAEIKGIDIVRQLAEERRDFEGEHVLVAADTLVVMGEKVYGKPADLDEAERFVHELGGKEHLVMTGVFLYRFRGGLQHSFREVTRVTLKKMASPEIRALFARVDPLDKAAGYGFQDAPEIVEKLVGSKTNVMGLPMARLEKELRFLLSARF